MKNLQVKKRSNRKGRLIILGSILAIILVYSTLAATFGLWPFVRSVELPNGSRPEQNTVTKNEDIPDNSNVDPNKTSDEVPMSSTLSAKITVLEQKDSFIEIAGDIGNAKTAGTCIFTFSNPNDRPVIKEMAATLKETGSYLCGPIRISELEFSYLGEWNVELRYYESGAQTQATSAIRIQ